jgi:hypothetical protein
LINKEQLNLGASSTGEDVWICGHCHQPADHANGIQNNPDELVLMLMCPSGRVTLGEWATEEEKAAQLDAYARELKVAQIAHELSAHGLSRTSLKLTISECQERAERETDPQRKASIEEECESYSLFLLKFAKCHGCMRRHLRLPFSPAPKRPESASSDE